MIQTNPAPTETKETTVVGTIRLVEIPVKVKSPVFEDVKVERPVFVDKTVEIPVGSLEMIETLVEKHAEKLLAKVEAIITGRLDKAIDQRIKEIKSPKIVEEVTVIHKDVEVERPVYKDVEVLRTNLKDVEVINPVLKNVEVVNAVIVDQTVINADIKDVKVTNAIITDVPVERAVIREKVVEVVHKMCHDQKGNAL